MSTQPCSSVTEGSPGAACAETASLRILFADAHLIVIDKPAGLPSVPGRAPGLQDCVSSRVQARFADARVVHRLDMATSGLLLMARGPDAQRRLSAAFEQRLVNKQYVAVVCGDPTSEGGDIELRLAADWPRRPLQKVDPDRGKPAHTRWQVDERRSGHCRLLLQPLTGRTHQLRLHLAAIGHPIWGDRLYAPPDVQALSPRLLLHACAVHLEHPATGAPCSFRSLAPF